MSVEGRDRKPVSQGESRSRGQPMMIVEGSRDYEGQSSWSNALSHQQRPERSSERRDRDLRARTNMGMSPAGAAVPAYAAGPNSIRWGADRSTTPHTPAANAEERWSDDGKQLYESNYPRPPSLSSATSTSANPQSRFWIKGPPPPPPAPMMPSPTPLTLPPIQQRSVARGLHVPGGAALDAAFEPVSPLAEAKGSRARIFDVLSPPPPVAPRARAELQPPPQRSPALVGTREAAPERPAAAQGVDGQQGLDEPVFWELALVWSLAQNELQKTLRSKANVSEAFMGVRSLRAPSRASRTDSRGTLEPTVSSGPLGCLRGLQAWGEALWSSDGGVAEDMVCSPTWRDVRSALVHAGLAVRLVSSNSDDEFFMVVGAPLSKLQSEATKRGLELRLLREAETAQLKLASSPPPFFPYQSSRDAHFERFAQSGGLSEPEPAAASASGRASGGADGADAEPGNPGGGVHGRAEAQSWAARAPALASMERQRLIGDLINAALIERCGVSTQALRNMHNACTDLIYLHDEYERRRVELSLRLTQSGFRLPRPADLSAHTLNSLEKTRRYFGEQVSFYFGFLRFYTRALIFPAAISVPTYIVYWIRADVYLLLVPAFCLLLMCWSAAFLEQWKQREATLRHIWDMEEYAEREQERLGFRGHMAQGVYTTQGHWVPIAEQDLLVMGLKLQTPYTLRASRLARKAREWGSYLVLLAMGFLCVLTTLAIFAFRAYIASLSVGPYLAGALNAVAITLLNTAFRAIALWLNEWENHRRASSFEAALVYKMFFFQFVNCYFSLFFIAFVKPYGIKLLFIEPSLCVGALRANEQLSNTQKCYDELQTQLMMIFLTNLVLGNLSERLSTQTAAISEWLSESLESYSAAVRKRAAQAKGDDPDTASAKSQALRRNRSKTRQARAAERRPSAKEGKGRQVRPGEPAGADEATRPSSPRLAIAAELQGAGLREGESAGLDWRAMLGRAPTMALLHRGRRLHADARDGAPAAQPQPFPTLAPGCIAEHQALRARLDEQDDLPRLLSEEHGLGPTFYEYNEMALQFGYICMFSVSFPPAALLALGNNLVEFTADAHKLLRECRRVKYEGAMGIAPWGSIFRFLEIIGVLTNTLIYLLLSDQFRSLDTATIGLSVLTIVIGVLFIKGVISVLMPDVPKSVLVDMRREKWIANALKMQLAASSPTPGSRLREPTARL